MKPLLLLTLQSKSFSFVWRIYNFDGWKCDANKRDRGGTEGPGFFVGDWGPMVVHLQPCPLTRGDLGVREYLSHVAALLHFTWLECTVPRNLFLYQWLCRGDRHSSPGQPASFQTGNYISFCGIPGLCGLMIQVPFGERLVYNLFIKSCWRKVTSILTSEFDSWTKVFFSFLRASINQPREQ